MTNIDILLMKLCTIIVSLLLQKLHSLLLFCYCCKRSLNKYIYFLYNFDFKLGSIGKKNRFKLIFKEKKIYLQYSHSSLSHQNIDEYMPLLNLNIPVVLKWLCMNLQLASTVSMRMHLNFTGTDHWRSDSDHQGRICKVALMSG